MHQHIRQGTRRSRSLFGRVLSQRKGEHIHTSGDQSKLYNYYYPHFFQYLLTSGKDSLVKLWELSTSRCLIAYTGAGTTGKQEHNTQAIFNHSEDYVLFPDEATTSLCSWNSRNASRLHLMSLGHNGPVRYIVHSPTHPAFLTCSDDFRARFWFRRVTQN